ncbi:MAG: efflux RND transporter permease subunit, partial [candidate division KSB1 bacterium]|nr:efflux RND transporter permease subunit [candidate division KSB1 bacterium]
MHISQLSIDRPVATAMFFVAVILIGIISLIQLPVDLLPDLSYPRLTIWTAATAMGPREVEEMITNPIEEAIGTVANIRRTYSISRSGLSLVTVEFLWGTNMDFATLSIREKLDQLRWILPREVERPNILRIDPRSQPIMAISLSGSNLVHLKELAHNVFKRRLEQIDGVAMATVTGGFDREIQVEVDQTKATALHLAPEKIAQALELANYSIAGGTVKKGLYRYALRTLGEFQSIMEIERVVVANHPDGSQIRISDIGRVIDGFRERQSITRFNNEESIGIIIRKDAGANTVIVSRLIHRILDQLRSEYPSLHLSVAYDGARFISSAISNVLQNLILGAILAFLVLFVFLHDFRNPVNIALSIPISVIATFALLYFAGITLNIMSLGGLALGVGMLVDNSIIVMENIFRHRQEGRALADAAFLGAKEVAMPITASTLTTIAIFLPVVYLYGVAGQLFRDQAVTVIFSLLASLVVALTLLPMLSCRFRAQWQQLDATIPNSTATKPKRFQQRPW